MTLTESEALDAGHPRFVSPLGDRRERTVPCARCLRSTLALSPPICGRCEPISADGPAAVAEVDHLPPVVGEPGRAPAPVPATPSPTIHRQETR